MSPLSLFVERYSNILVPPPRPGANVCATCRRRTDGWPHCWQCNEHLKVTQDLSDAVVPISLAVKGSQLAHVLRHYKYSPQAAVRRQFTNELAWVLATFLSRHERCLGDFDLVTVVPGTEQREGAHPLVDILGRRLGSTRGRFAEGTHHELREHPAAATGVLLGTCGDQRQESPTGRRHVDERREPAVSRRSPETCGCSSGRRPGHRAAPRPSGRRCREPVRLGRLLCLPAALMLSPRTGAPVCRPASPGP